LPERSIFRLLARDSHRLFPDEGFADLFTAEILYVANQLGHTSARFTLKQYGHLLRNTSPSRAKLEAAFPTTRRKTPKKKGAMGSTGAGGDSA
jgi:hypothetical protein